jgi:hypothetical protein
MGYKLYVLLTGSKGFESNTITEDGVQHMLKRQIRYY